MVSSLTINGYDDAIHEICTVLILLWKFASSYTLEVLGVTYCVHVYKTNLVQPTQCSAMQLR